MFYDPLNRGISYPYSFNKFTVSSSQVKFIDQF